MCNRPVNRWLHVFAALTNPAERQRRFLKLWTLKEAYLKAVGRGISGYPGLAGFTVDPRPAAATSSDETPAAASATCSRTSSADVPTQPAGSESGHAAIQIHMLEDEVHFVPPEGVDAGKWQFALMQPTARHIAAVCVRTRDGTEERQEQRPLNITAREAVPLMWDSELGTVTGADTHDGVAVMTKL